MTKVNGNNNVSAESQIVNGKKVKKQEQPKNQKQVFNNQGQKTPQKPNDSAIKQEVYKKSGYQLKDTKDRNKIIQLKVNGKIRSYKTVGTLTTGGRILVQDEKGAYHVVSHTKDNKLVMLKDDYAKNKIFYESTSSEHKVKYGKKNYVITNSKRDRHGRMSAVDENGKRVVLSSDGKELKTGYVEAEDQKDNMNDYIAKQTKGKSKAEADKIRQQILSGNSSYANKGVLRFKASNGEVWYYDTKRKTYVKYADKEAQAIIKDLDKGATENWGLFRTGLGTDYELLKNTNAQIIDPEVLGKVNKHYSAEYGNKVDKNAQYGSGKYKTAYEAFLASEIGDDEVYQFNATLVKNNAITDQTRRNEILQTNLTKVGSRANRLAAADAASRKEDYQTLQDAAEEENKKKNYKAPFKGSDALQTYIYGVNKGDVQEIDDFNTTLIDPKEDMIDRDEVVKIKAETGALWAKKGKYDKAFEAQDGEVVDKMFALQDANGKVSLNVKELKAKAKGFQGEYLMFAKPELFTEQELADKAVSMLTVALDQFDFLEKQNSLQSESVLHNLSHSRSDVVASAMSDNGTKNASKNAIEASISKAYTLIRNDKVLNLVKQKMGDKFNLLQKKEQAMFKTNTFANVTSKSDSVKSNLSAEEVAQNKYVVSWLRNQLEDLERDKKMNEAKEGWKQTVVNAMRTSLRAGETRESLANKYDLIKSNMARLEAAAEGKLVDKNGKPVSFEDAMKNLGEAGIQALEKANQDYQSAQATGEFVVDMAVLAIPIPGLSTGNIVRMAGTLYKVVGTSGKMYKVVKVTAEAVKGQKIINYTTKVATKVGEKVADFAVKHPTLTKSANYAIKTADSSATGAMHMAVKTAALEASNIATSREGFTADRVSEMNEKTKGAALFGGMGGAIGGTTGAVAEFVSSKGAKYAVHTLGLVADVAGAAGLITAESHGETNFWDNLRCVNPDGSFNFEQASMTAMMIFGHLHGMSSVKGKAKPQVELQADGTIKAKLGNNELTLNKDGIWSDSASGREFRLAENKAGKAELTELSKKEIYNSRQKTEVKDGMTLEDFRQELKNNDLRGDVYTKADGGKLVTVKHSRNKYELFEFDNNNNMISKKSVVGKSAINESYPEFANAESSGTMGSTSGYLGANKLGGNGNKSKNVENLQQDNVNKPELTALCNELGITETQKKSHFVGETDGANTVINEMKGNKTVKSYIVSRDAEGKAYIAEKVSYKNGKATDVKFYDADGSIKKLPAETKQAALEELNKPAETDPISHSERSEESQAVLKTEQESVIASESEAIQSKPETKATETESHADSNPETNKPAENDKTAHSEANKEFSTNDIPVELSKMEEYVKNSNVVEFPENENTYTYSIKNDKTGRLMYVRFNNKSGKRSSITIVEANKQEQHIEFPKDGENPTKVTYKDADGNIIKYAEYEYNENNKRTKEIDRNADGSPIESSEYEYSDAGNVIKRTDALYSEGKVTSSTEYEYNDGNVVKSTKSEYEKGELAGITESEYKDGNLVEETWVSADGNKTKITKNEYKDGTLIKSREELKTDNSTEITEKEYNDGKVVKRKITNKNGITEQEYNDGKLITETIKDVNGNTTQISKLEYKDQNLRPTKETQTQYKDGEVVKTTEYEYDDGYKLTKTTQKDADGNITQVTEKEYSKINGTPTKETKTQFKDGKPTEITETEYEDLKPTKEINKDAEGNITEIYDYEQRRTLTAEEIKEYLSNKDNNIQTQPAETNQPATDKPVVGEDSQVTGEQKKSSLILPGDERKPAHIKTVDEFAQEDRQPAKFQTKEELEAFDRKPVQIKTAEEFAKEDRKPVEIKTEEQFAKEDNKPVEIKTEEEFAKENSKPVEIKTAEELTNEGRKPLETDSSRPSEPVSESKKTVTGNTAEEASQIHNEEMNNVEPTSTAQVKNLEKYDIMFQSKEGKALLDKAKKDPNFGKTAEERVPSDKIVKDADGNIQSIEIDGITYTRNEQGKYVNGDSEIKIYEPNEAKRYDGSIIDKEITIDKENNKIQKIKSDGMTIEYDSNGQPERVFVLGGKSIDLYTGAYYQDYGNTYVDPAGRVIENYVSIDINGRKYHPDNSEGTRYSDWGRDTNGNIIDSELHTKTENSLSDLIEDTHLENRGLRTTKKGRQKAYDEVRNQIEDAYKNNKIDRETADNLQAKLNEKAEANGLETQETPTIKAEREALAKWNEQVDALKDNLMSDIEKVDFQASHDQMVEKIGEACKNGEIDIERANELYDALEAKANSIDGVESLAQKAKRINAELKAHEGELVPEEPLGTEEVSEAESGAIPVEEKPVTAEESAPVGEETPTDENSESVPKKSHIKRNLAIGAGVLAVGGVAYGISKLTKSDDDKEVKQPAKPAAKPASKKDTPAPKAETKVTLDGKEGTIAEDGTLTLDGKPYPKAEDGTYTIGDKKYKVENGKLVEVVDTPDDNGETGGADPAETTEVKGTIDGKEYTIKDGTVTIDGDQFDPHSDGFYHIGNAKYTIGADGKLVKADETTQAGSDSAQTGNTDATSQQTGNAGNATQTGNTNTTGNNTHVTAPAQPVDNSASARTTGTTHNDTSVTTRHTNVPAEESRANSSRPSEQSEESRHTGNTPVTGATEPTEDQKQVANALQNEISNISTQADAQAFFTKLTSAVKNGQITIMQSDELLNLVKAHVETLVEADRAQDEISSKTQPAQQQDGVTTPAEPKRNKKREITPMERMELTEEIRKAKTRDDIAKIQQEMRQYKVFQGRKNLRRAYKAKLRAIKHQGESNADKYDKKFEKRMEKVSDDNIKFNNAEFLKQANIDEELRRKYRDFEA